MKLSILILILSTLLFVSCTTGVPKEDVASVYYNLGNAYIELKRPKEAVIAFEKAIALNPSLIKATYNLARIYLEGESPEQGIKILEELLSKEPENSLVKETLAYGYFSQGNNERALKLYEEILVKDPYYSNALHNAALIHLNLGNNIKAGEYLERLYLISPRENLLRGMGIVARRLGDNEKAMELLSVYLQRYKEDMATLEILGDIYTDEQYYLEALEAYTKILEKNDSNNLLHFKKARILLVFIQDKEKGMQALDAALGRGFADEEMALELIKEASPLLAGELEKLFTEKKIVNPEGTGVEDESPQEEESLEVFTLPEYY